MLNLRKILTLFACLLLAASPSYAAVVATPIFPQALHQQTTHFIQGTDVAGTYKTIYTGDADGSKIIGVYISTTDATATHLSTLAISSSTSDHCATATTCAFVTADVTALGTGSTQDTSAVNWLNNEGAQWPRDSDGNPFIYLSSTSQTLEFTFATALTASTKISVTVIAVDF